MMKKKWLSLLLLLCLFLPMSVSAQETEFDITNQSILGEISTDGSVKFTDKLTYDITYMNGMYFNLDRTGYNVLDYRIGVMDSDTGEISYFEENATGNPETFQLMASNEFYQFKVFYPTSKKKVTFVVEYTIGDLVTNFSDTAEFNRKIVGTNTDEYLDVEAVIVLPGKVQTPDDFRAWAHGAPQGELSLIDYQGKSAVKLTVPNNPPNQFVEADIIFPTALTPNNKNRRQVNKKAEIIERENGQVEKDRQQYETSLGWKRFGVGILTLLFPISTIGVWYYYLSRKRRLNPNPVKLPKHIYTLPEDITPAIMATSVFRTKPTTDDLSATIVDLARKGYLKLTEIAKEKRGLFSHGESTTIYIEQGAKYAQSDTLQKHEKYALNYVLPNGNPTTLQALEESAAKSKSVAKKQYKLWTSFTNFTQIRGLKLRGSDSQQQIASTLASISLIAIPVIVIFILSLIEYTKYAAYLPVILLVGVICFVANGIAFILILMRPIRTAEQDRRIQEWTGFRNMLNDIGNFKMREIGSLDLWEEYLVYAIALGVADRVIEAMKIQFRPFELQEMHVGGGFYNNPYLFTRVMNQSIQNSVRASQPAPVKYSGTNSGGFGGGFSGGSSGGSGGGSGAGGF
ncbi:MULTISPECIES: DUF2207 domain-containing protein [unclassified Facklamia]|uniref:DUF2207 domain-containing protein n=1 Tax=Aerococcaceae TaxID=186827 RepID=UPI0013B7C978|nr:MULTISPECIES: DUF2207 domain-containing protein [unclassified Facklamia]NEW64881.1 DUF2207 domain-containing protein [Facklamia sp. 252]NEW68203.1 DUF2207 domain-containing protein [Facklamia sp. 253]QQD66048.1 DUF2207 domain-containing protein [Aerococcaceae bacterium zg-252]